MKNNAYQHLLATIKDNSKLLSLKNNNFDSLLESIGDARFVLMGEESHGTYEFYQARIEITQQLIEKKGFMAVAVEGDWPDVYKIHRYIQGKGDQANWQSALEGFKRFPTWMWRNETMVPFLQWLRQWNDSSVKQKIGFYGLDLYSLQTSMEAVIKYLESIDPKEAELARRRYACFDHLKIDPQSYGYLTSAGLKKSCVKESVEQFLKMQEHAIDYVKQDGQKDDEYFYATQNARLVKNAEKYYRSMYEGHVASWNIRDTHMAETLNVIADHLENIFAKSAKIVVWAHNSHIGDARATEAGERDEINIGQLVREQHDNNAYLIGFSTYTGTVTAANDWDEPYECKSVNPALDSSYEHVFHDTHNQNFLLNLRGNSQLEHFLQLPRLERAIGVIYRPDTERQSHYFFARMPYQFDSIIHFDITTAVKPL